MNVPVDQKSYAKCLQRIAQSLAVAKNDQVTGDIGSGHTTEKVKMFTDGNLDKRFQKIQDEVELLGDVIEDLDEFIVRYVKTVPLAAYDTGSSDGSRFAKWLDTACDLTPEARDIATVIRSRTAVEDIARRNRTAHIRFQEWSSLSEPLAEELGKNERLRIHLNPIRLWASFESSLFLDEDDVIPGGTEVLFYAIGTEVTTAALEPEGRTIVRALADLGPCSLADLHEHQTLATGLDQQTLQQIVADSSQAGIIAFS